MIDSVVRYGLLCFMIPFAVFAATSPTTRPAAATSRPAAASAQHPASAPASQPVHTVAIPFAEQTVAGNTVVFPAGYAGKLVLLHFWASWCPHSGKEVPFWREAYAKYHDRGLEIVGLSLDKNKRRTLDQLKAFLADNHMTWEQVFDNAQQLSRIYRIDSLPTSLLVDGTTGEILIQGASLRRDGLARQIEAHLPATRPAP